MCSARPGTPWGTCRRQRHSSNELNANTDANTDVAPFLHSCRRICDNSSECHHLQHIADWLVQTEHSHKEADDQDGHDADALHILPKCFPLQLNRQLHGERFLRPQWTNPSGQTTSTDTVSAVQGLQREAAMQAAASQCGKAGQTLHPSPTRMDFVRSIGERLSSMDFIFSSSMARNSWSRLKVFLDCNIQ
jgi:hypothetical protein